MRELDDIAQWLASREAAHPFAASTSLPSPSFMRGGREYVSFSTNNYLALATDPLIVQAAKDGLDRYGMGNCESRLLGGDIELYREVEARLAALTGKDEAVLFGAGYLANLGALGTLVRGSQLARLYGYKPTRSYRYTYFSDELNHVSINEGIRLSGADKVTYRHGDLEQLEDRLQAAADREKIIVTDGVFSQDGDIAPLPQLLQLAERHDATVYVDDAHGFGVLGTQGAGVAEHFGLRSDRLIYMATLSKAIGVNGGFVATDAATAQVLRLGSPAYGFTGSILPDQAAAVTAALGVLASQPERRRQLWDNQRYFVEKVRALGYRLVSDETPVVPLLVGDEARGDAMAAALLAAGIYVDAVKFPAVALHQCRLRFIMNARHTRAQIDRVLDVLATLAPSYVDPGPVRRTGSDKPARAPRPTGQPVPPGIQTDALAEIARIARDDFGITQPIDPDQSLRTDLNLDSMGLAIVAGGLEDRFGVSFDTPEASDIDSVRDLLEYVARHATPEAAG